MGLIQLNLPGFSKRKRQFDKVSILYNIRHFKSLKSDNLNKHIFGF